MRSTKTRVKTAKGRKISSTLWLKRQLNDPYVQQAKREGYRSRAAYKLMEIDDRFHLLKPGMTIVDLGAAPGSWLQVAASRTKAGVGKTTLVGIDLLPVAPVAGSACVEMDFMDEAAPARLQTLAGGPVDGVLSDMAPNTTGHGATDHLRIVALVEAAFVFACDVLKPDGFFVAKVWQGGTEQGLLAEIKRRFTEVKHVKPKASRQGSAEIYLVAQGFRGSLRKQ